MPRPGHEIISMAAPKEDVMSIPFYADCAGSGTDDSVEWQCDFCCTRFSTFVEAQLHEADAHTHAAETHVADETDGADEADEADEAEADEADTDTEAHVTFEVTHTTTMREPSASARVIQQWWCNTRLEAETHEAETDEADEADTDTDTEAHVTFEVTHTTTMREPSASARVIQQWWCNTRLVRNFVMV
jgi:hypothetical protein